MFYVYILQSIHYPHQTYIGRTTDLNRRLVDHNTGTTSHTARYRPWRFRLHVGFENEDKAYAFERYLKTASGRAFANKRLL
jgi:predicted GIY-YIG superfamily endonuclease